MHHPLVPVSVLLGAALAAQPPEKQDLRQRLLQRLDVPEPPATLEVDGRIFEVAALLRQCKELERKDRAALAEALVLQLLRERMIARGCYLDDRRFDEAFAAEEAEFAGTPFNLEVLATKFKGYPNMQTYRPWFRLRQSFEGSIAGGIDEKVLDAEAARQRGFLASDTLTVRTLHFPARDGETGAWDLAAARRRAEAALATASKVATSRSATRKAAAGPEDDPFAGAPVDRRQTLNQLRKRFGESEHSLLTTGAPVVERLFATAAKGAVLGPLRGRDGFWLVRVDAVDRGEARLDLSTPQMQELLRKIHVDRRFAEWVTEELGKVVIKDARRGR